MVNLESLGWLRISSWIALGLLVVNSIFWVGFLDGPVTGKGDRFQIHWVPAIVFAWFLVASAVLHFRRDKGVRLSKPYPRSTRDLD